MPHREWDEQERKKQRRTTRLRRYDRKLAPPRDGEPGNDDWRHQRPYCQQRVADAQYPATNSVPMVMRFSVVPSATREEPADEEMPPPNMGPTDRHPAPYASG